MGFKTIRPNGARHHARELTVKFSPTGRDFVVLGTLDEAVLRDRVAKEGFPDADIDVDWWALGRGVPRKWERDDVRGEPGARVKIPA